jgi:hypothetical protein
MQRSTQNTEKYTEYREVHRIQRSTQNTEKYTEYRDPFSVTSLKDR